MPKAAKLALLSGFLGWMFDSMDLNLFTLVLVPTIKELTGAATPAAIAANGGIVIGLKIFGWGLGGILFGVAADRIGRSRTLVLTILVYAAFTALSGFVQSFWQLAILQCLAGIGIGGEWAAGAALIAETWPERTRVRAMQVMQMAFAFGFFLAAGVNIVLGPIGWRYVLFAGIAPAIATLFIRAFVPEPDRWLAVRHQTLNRTAVATFGAIFAPDIRRNTLVGVTIAFAMMAGSWAALTLLPGWISQLLGPANALQAAWTVSWSFMLMNFGAVAGYVTLIFLADPLGRRWSYFIFCVGSLGSILYTFQPGTDLARLQTMLPVLGFFTVGGFGTFAAYLPELFPTRIRATGQGFCYNMSRMLTAPGPLIVGTLVGTFGSIPHASSAVALILLVGMVAIWFGPETARRPLRD
jgi:MFS family permease